MDCHYLHINSGLGCRPPNAVYIRMLRLTFSSVLAVPKCDWLPTVFLQRYGTSYRCSLLRKVCNANGRVTRAGSTQPPGVRLLLKECAFRFRIAYPWFAVDIPSQVTESQATDADLGYFIQRGR